MSVQDFLLWEDAQSEKHEFVDGEIRSFAGGTNRHNLIAAGLVSMLRTLLRGRCRVTGSDTRVVTASRSRYPDVVVTCDERDRLAAASVSHPILLIEVLSEGTHAIDREEKFDEYRLLPSLGEYVVVDSRRRWAQTLSRAGDVWVVSLPIERGSLDLASVGAQLAYDEIYADTEL